MNRTLVSRKRPVYIGLVVIAAGLALKKLVEVSLVSDGRVESPMLLAVIYLVQAAVVVLGVFLAVKQPTIRTPTRAEVLLPLFSLVLTFALLEIGARGWLAFLATPEQRDLYILYSDLKPSQFAWTPHHYLGYYPTPNYSKGNTHHNSLGYRGEEISLEKPAGVYRIVALGGSSTYDVRIEDDKQTFTAQLEAMLRAAHGSQSVEVINAGVPGYNSWEMLGNLEFRVLDLSPDLIIIYEGTNDVHARLVEPAAYHGDDSGRRQLWQPPPVALWERSALLRILSRMTQRTRQVSVDDFVSSPTYLSWPYESRLAERHLDPFEVLEQNPPIYFQRNLENMIAVAQANGVTVLLSTWASSPYLNDYAAQDYYQVGFRENNDVVRNVAKSQGVLFFDFVLGMPQDAQYWADGRHVNEAGALEKARLFADFIEAHDLLK
jgi:lysophospholipase L1-like esterase